MGAKPKHWIVIFCRTGEVAALPHDRRITALRHADEHFKPRYFGNVLVKNEATFETWERRGITWMKLRAPRPRKLKRAA